MNEEIVTLTNPLGHALYGIVHHPLVKDEARNKTGVLFVHSGVRGRVGTGRQYVYYARNLAKAGYLVCRFDPYGMGDSEGVVETSSSKTYYRSIQLGRYVEDSNAWIQYLREQHNLEKIILSGLCGGAITSLLAGGANSLVDGMFLLNPPVMLDGENVDYLLKRPKEYYKKGLLQYLRKISDPSSLWHFFTGQADYSLIMFFIKGLLKRGKCNDDEKNKNNDSNAEFNHGFLKNLHNFTAKGKKLLFIYGDNDYFKIEFEQEIISRCQGQLPATCEYITIPDANHMLTLPKWQQDVLHIFLSWLERV